MSLIDEKFNAPFEQSGPSKPAEVHRVGASQAQDPGLWVKLSPKLTAPGDHAQLWKKESDYSSALRLIQKASEAIDMLQDRCRRLENNVRETNERLKVEAASSERVINDWEQLATALKTKLAKTEADLAGALQKAKTSEDRANAADARAQATESRLQASNARALDAESRATTAEKRVAQEIELATSFRQKIVETFGAGSGLSAILGA